ncbi:MAG: hypothetical protein IH819_13565, partial [Bacteroidetes bacterium]|nr:hypothetical protein [Bacteroidota bacterium]
NKNNESTINDTTEINKTPILNETEENENIINQTIEINLEYKVGTIYDVDDNGIVQNLTHQVKNVLGRAIYQSGKFWVDSELQKRKANNEKRIQFNTDEYFKLLNDKPETAQFLALGQNVRFYFDDTFYEIYE